MTIAYSANGLMKGFARAAIVVIAAGIAALPFQLQAAGPIIQFKTEVSFHDFLVPNVCTGEIINETGTITVWVQRSVDATGRVHLMYHEHFAATGIGSFGNEYVIQDQVTENRIAELPDGSVELIDRFQFVQISKGPGENSRFYQTLRITLHPDGTVEVEILDTKFDCQG